MQTQITVLVVEPQKVPYTKIIVSGLESLQREVGGDIEAVYPFDDPIAIICNSNGKLTGQPLNRALWNKAGEIYDIIAGAFWVVGLAGDRFGSLDSAMLSRFRERFLRPEFTTA